MAGHGVRPPRGLAGFLAAYPDHAIGHLPSPNPAAGYAYAHSRIGCPYDYTAIPAFIAPRWLTAARRWQESAREFCSELAGASAVHAGVALPQFLPFFSPNDMAALCGLAPAQPAAGNPGEDPS